MAYFNYKRDIRDFVLISEDERIAADRHGWHVHSSLVPTDVRPHVSPETHGNFSGGDFYLAALSFTVKASSIAWKVSLRNDWETGPYLSPDEMRYTGAEGTDFYPILDGEIPLREADCTPFERGKVSRPYRMNGVRFDVILEGADSIERQDARDNQWGFFIYDFSDAVPQSLFPAHLTPEMCKHLHKVYGAFLWDEAAQAFVPDKRLQENFDRLIRKATKYHTLVIDGEEFHFPITNTREEYRGANMKVARKFILGDAQVNGKSFPVRRTSGGTWELDN